MNEDTTYVESPARTSKLFCSECKKSIPKGDLVVFELRNGKMVSAYDETCGVKFLDLVADDECHPFDLP